MPKKKKKENPEVKEPTVISTPEVPEKEPSNLEPIPEIDQPETDEPEVDRNLLKLGFCLRTGIEYWKAQLVGKPLMKHISQAYVAYSLGIPIKTDPIFQQIERINLDVIHDIEAFESILFPAAEQWLANKKK